MKAVRVPLRSDPMSTSRPKLKLDERSFQDMLAAAFTIQEHNAKRKLALQPQPACRQCGAPAKTDEQLCGGCAGDEFRPGEQMQRKWASLWLMTQEQGLFPERPTEEEEIESGTQAMLPRRFPEALEIGASDEPTTVGQFEVGADEVGEVKVGEVEVGKIEVQDEADEESAREWRDGEWRDGELDRLSPMALRSEIIAEGEPGFADAADLVEVPEDAAPALNLRDLRLKLRFHRADVYLVLAIVVSLFAMVWVLSATPTPSAQHKPRLRLWERALVSVGLAEAPQPAPRRGNPNIQVWEDPRTALYYCVGEEQYSKTPGGRATTQREAQLDQFEPASRAACE